MRRLRWMVYALDWPMYRQDPEIIIYSRCKTQAQAREATRSLNIGFVMDLTWHFAYVESRFCKPPTLRFYGEKPVNRAFRHKFGLKQPIWRPPTLAELSGGKRVPR